MRYPKPASPQAPYMKQPSENSRKHLTKIIVEVFNKSPKQIIAEAIVLEAKVMLKNPKYSVSDVVTELNFIDTSVFSKFFKNYAGVSPTTFIASN